MTKPTLYIPLVFTVLFSVLCWANPAIIDEHFETLLADYRFKLRNLIIPPEIPGNIAVVAIDEKSLAEYGRWPWSRRLQARLIETIMKDGPKAVAVDIIYPEPESPQADGILADVFSRYRENLVVALGFGAVEGKRFEGETPDILWDNSFLNVRDISFLHPIDAFRSLTPPDPIAGSAMFGHVYYLPDRDGKVRWEHLVIRYGDDYIPSLALQTARIALGVSPEAMTLIGGTGVDLDGRLVPMDRFCRLHVNYLGRENTLPYISAADILSGRVAPGSLMDKILVLGATAIGTYDLKVTPFSANMAGAEKNATIIANILSENYLFQAPVYADVLVVLLAGIAVIIVCRRLSAIYSILAFFFIVAILFVGNQIMLSWFDTRMNLVYPLNTVLVNGVFLISYRYFIEERSGREIRNMFSSYVTERVVDELVRNPDMARLGGERREITVLFSDIKGFTYFSERTEPEQVVALLNEYLKAMTEVVFHWEGTLDKFMGDAIVAFWNAPLKQDNHAERAMRCALHMINRLEELQEEWSSRGQDPFDIGVGINTGEVVVGNIGAEGKKMDYTIIGDHVNLGSRLEGLTRKYDTNILISGFTLERIQGLVDAGKFGHVSIKSLETVTVKGREASVEVFAFKPLEEGADSTDQQTEQHISKQTGENH